MFKINNKNEVSSFVVFAEKIGGTVIHLEQGTYDSELDIQMCSD